MIFLAIFQKKKNREILNLNYIAVFTYYTFKNSLGFVSRSKVSKFLIRQIKGLFRLHPSPNVCVKCNGLLRSFSTTSLSIVGLTFSGLLAIW